MEFENEDQRKDPEVILEKMKDYCIGECNEIYERYVFNRRDLEGDESVDAYVTALRKLAKTCNYGSLTDSLIRDRMVVGINDNSARKKLLQTSKLTLGQCIDICRSSQTSARQLKEMNQEDVRLVKDNKKKQLTKGTQSIGVIQKVDTPTSWISALVVTAKKNGKVRLCIDPKPLNEDLHRNHYPLPTIDDVLPLLSKALVFTVLVAKNGFWHIQLDESSSFATTFGTPWGRYRWLRLPFGVCPAPEEFQRRIDVALEGLQGQKAIADDILVFGAVDTDEEALKNHDHNLREVFIRCRQKGIKLNPEKIQFRQKRVSYMGHIISSEGLQGDPNKLKAINEMPPPTDKEGVQRVLGMINYVPKFAPNLADLAKPLRELVKKDNKYIWDKEVHGQCLDQVKQALTQAPVLKFFDPKRRPYSKMSCQSNIVFKGERIIVPSSLRQCILAKVHASHLGIQGCLRRAKEAFYWPGIYKQITEFISRCSICNSYKPQQQKEPLKCHEIPARPWQSISADLFEFKGTQYLITTDRYSNFFEFDILTSTTARSVNDKLKPHLARYGLPDRINTDKGPQFDCAEFQKFAAEYQSEHVKTSPRYPQSNGKAENSVKTADNILKKAADARHDPHLSLLDFRNTPSEGMESTRTQHLFARGTRTLLPTARHLLQPKVIPHVHRNLQLRQNEQSFFFNRGAKDLQPLRDGDVVRVRPLPGHSRWFKAQVNRQEAPRSYQVRREDGRVYRRNRSHLYKVPHNFQAMPDEDSRIEGQCSNSTLHQETY
ncbi:Uncharacterized protein K02A2.6 [Stylophora pistillata]|uniref:Uncharacterized protein K02A2.6 n=1 Tax=Stylophora pistillata TaxID=50429 RepID=A0A2B4T1H1_STYPI|nr:Uncharacterized protein K02A2.6 [Stylophora pistillata]